MRIQAGLWAITLFTLFLFGCNNSANKDKSTTPAGTTTADITPKAVAPAPAAESASATYQQLQGTWQHVADTANYLAFEGNHRKEKAAGMQQWDDETFVLADKCANAADKSSEAAPEKDKYISCPASDQCWYITSLNQQTLSLSYMGRGNTLTYKRVK